MGALLLIGAGWALLHALGISACLFHRLTGWPCLTCGSSRAAALLFSGEPFAALEMQPLAVAAAAAAGVWMVFDAFSLWVLRRAVSVSLERADWRVFLCVAAVSALANWAYLLWRGV